MCGGLVLVHVGLGVAAARHVGVTMDEPTHLATGYLAWTKGDFRIDPIHPPLARLWMSWPLLLQDLAAPQFKPQHLSWNKFVPPVRQWIHQSEAARRLLFWPRMANLMWTAGLAAAVWWWLRRRGPLAAALGAGLVALSPNLLAHGSLATTDASVAVAFAAGTVAFWRLTRCVSPGRMVLAGLAVGATVLCKFSGLLIVPVCVILAISRALLGGPVHWRLGGRGVCGGVGRKSAALALALSAVAMEAYVLIWALYGFRYSAGPADAAVVYNQQTGPHLTADYWEVKPEHRQATGLKLLLAVREAHLLPEAYVYGVVTLLYREAARDAFLLGQYKKGGWWYYFPVAMLLKTPLPTLIVLGLGTGLVLSRACRRRLWPGRRCFINEASRSRCSGRNGWRWVSGKGLTWPAAVGAIVYGAAALRSEMNIGLRHFLPVFVLLVLAAVPAFAARARGSRLGLVATAGLGLWLLGAVVCLCPHFLCYFNELIGGPANGHIYLADSNIDWGQGLPDLAEYQRTKATGPVKLFYLGVDDPREYDIVTEPHHQAGQPPHLWKPGTYVVSVNYLRGIGTPLGPRWLPAHGVWYKHLLGLARAGRLGRQEAFLLSQYCWHRFLTNLRARTPDDRAGYSLLVYHLGRDELAGLLADTGGP